MTDDIIMDRIFKHFNTFATDDIDMEEWILGFNIFLKGKFRTESFFHLEKNMF